jgi:hypothetical protein
MTSDTAPPSKAYPSPGLLINYCHVKQLNLTLAHTLAHGIVTTQTQTTESLQPTRFAEIDDALRRYALKGSRVERADPTFLSFGGMEWDFKNWRCAYPQSQTSWRRAIASLKMQAEHARRQWPSIRVVFSRTMFKPTYGTFGCPCCAIEAHFWHYNHLLRQRELNWPSGGGEGGGDGGGGGGSGGGKAGDGAGSAMRRSARRGGAKGVTGPVAVDNGVCSGIHVLDMQRMMLCNDSVGTCVENNATHSLWPRLWLSGGFFSHPQIMPQAAWRFGQPRRQFFASEAALAGQSGCFEHTIGGHVLLPHGLDRRRPARVTASQLAVREPPR